MIMIDEKRIISVFLLLIFLSQGLVFSYPIKDDGDNSIGSKIYLFNQMKERVLLFDPTSGEVVHHMYVTIGTPLATIDYDSDGDLDLLETSYEAILIFTNDKGNYDNVTNICDLPPQGQYLEDLTMGALAVGDFNNDGQQDFLTGGVQGVIRLFVNNNSQSGKPNFKNFSTLAIFDQCAWGLTVADFNNDGYDDFAASYGAEHMDYSAITIFYNNGDLTFNQENIFQIEDHEILDLISGDFDNDGDIDLIFTKNIHKYKIDGWPINIKGSYILLENNGNNLFPSERVIATRGHDLLFYYGIIFHQFIQQPIKHLLGFNRFNPQLTNADYDNDGDIDFIVGDNSGKIELFLNDGNGNFDGDGVIHRYGYLTRGITSGDFDNDGDIDIVIAALSGYQNWGNGNVWLKQNQLNP